MHDYLRFLLEVRIKECQFILGRIKKWISLLKFEFFIIVDYQFCFY